MKLLIRVIHERVLKTLTTYPFVYVIFHLCRDIGEPIWHYDKLHTLTRMVDIGFNRDEANLSSPSIGLGVELQPLSKNLADTMELPHRANPATLVKVLPPSITGSMPPVEHRVPLGPLLYLNHRSLWCVSISLRSKWTPCCSTYNLGRKNQSLRLRTGSSRTWPNRLSRWFRRLSISLTPLWYGTLHA